MYGDKKKPCCSCGKGAVLKEGSHFYCPDHYAIFVLGKTLTGSTNVSTGCANDW